MSGISGSQDKPVATLRAKRWHCATKSRRCCMPRTRRVRTDPSSLTKPAHGSPVSTRDVDGATSASKKLCGGECGAWLDIARATTLNFESTW